MATTVNHPYSYDSSRIFDLFTQKEFIVQKYAHVGASNFDFIEFGEKDGTFIIHTTRDIHAEIPGFAKKFLKPTTTIEQQEIWTLSDDAIKKGTVSVKAKGLPMKMAGDLLIQPTDTGCENILTYEITVSIPLIGGKLARFLDEEGRGTADKEYAFALEFLSKE